MKTNYTLGYWFIALFLIFSSCSKDENEVIVESEKTAIEPDFIKNDGSEGIEDELQLDEEEPILTTDTNSKSYRHCNYTLLTPSDVDVEACGDTTTMPLLVGSRKLQVGNVTVSNDGENLYLNFEAINRNLMKKVYLYIGAKENIPFYSNGFPNLRKFNYKAFPYYYGGMKKATYVIPLSSIDLDCFEIVAYSKVYNKDSRCYYTSFAYDQTLDQQYSYHGWWSCVYYGDWVRSFGYCKQECKVECIQAYGFHAACGFCENNVFTTFLAHTFINSKGDEGVDIELLINPDGCDITNSSDVGHINISSISDTKLKIEYQLNTGYEMCGLSFGYGASKTSITSEYSKQFDASTTAHSFEIDKPLSANIYMISKAEITPSN
ncbi:hypothetical protein [Aquimarina macrocephali]|uniref:hypothetical protein n=1 Tax=Aquimarina macrocephali TaxID=666563 RepID=UPI0004671899|nr:hypothetical protein [Aquimarina macrocephali]